MSAEVVAEPDMVEPGFLTARQFAKLLQVSLRTLWRMRSAGTLPQPLRLGGVVRWRKRDVDQWIADGCPPGA